MGRVCQICHVGAGAFVRQRAKEGKMPRTIIGELSVRYSINITYVMYRWHVQHHDLRAGTNVLVKKGLDAKAEQIEKSYEQSQKLVANVEGFLSKIMSFQQEISSENFQLLPADKQIAIINQTIGTITKLKATEMNLQKLNMERNPALLDINMLISQTKGKQKPIYKQEPKEIKEKEEETVEDVKQIDNG